jgi:uncharacterized membrane protein YiaA
MLSKFEYFLIVVGLTVFSLGVWITNEITKLGD